MTTREQSLEWWNNLPDVTISTEINKSTLTKKYKGQFRMYASLTGSEIEEIWRKEDIKTENIYFNRLKEQYKHFLNPSNGDEYFKRKDYYQAMRLFCLDTQLISFNDIEVMEYEVNSSF